MRLLIFLAFLIQFSIYGAVAYVALHFIGKYW